MEDYKKLYNTLYKKGYHKSGFAGKTLMSFLQKKYTLSPKDQVLDIGCSNGSGVKIINDLAGSNICYGFDAADDAIDYCNRKNPNNKDKYKVASLPNIPFDDDAFNVIFCSDVLEHLFPEDVDESFNEINRVTQKNSHIFLDIALVPESNRYNDVLCQYQLENLHATLFSSEKWFDIFNQHNLKIQDYVVEHEVNGKKINGKDYSNKEGALHIYLTKK